jgi:RNA polymerase sigma-70 factor (ECF subfamily)
MYSGSTPISDEVRAQLLVSIRKHLLGILQLRQFLDSEDVLHNVLLRLMAAAEKVKPPTQADLLRLAARHIRWELIDLYRTYFGPTGPGGKHAPMSGPQLDSAFADHTAPDAHSAIALAEAVDQLPDELRQTVDLLFYHDLTHEQAAELLGTTSKTIQRRWRNARIQLGRMLT